MKHHLHILSGAVVLTTFIPCGQSYTLQDAPIEEVSFTNVHLGDNFWSPKMTTDEVEALR